MLVDEQVINNLCNEAGEKRTQKARMYKSLGRAKITNVEYKDSRNFEISGLVVGSERYSTYVEIKNGEVENITCTCDDYYSHYGVCKHTLSTVMQFSEESHNINDEQTKEHRFVKAQTSKANMQYKSFRQIVNTF